MVLDMYFVRIFDSYSVPMGNAFLGRSSYMTLIEQLLIYLLDFFVEVCSASIKFDPEMLVMICLQVIKINSFRKIFLSMLI